jgi:ELWxxDGT repeat protein
MPLKRRRSDVVWTLVWAGVLAANCTGQFTARIPRYLDSSTSNPGPLFSDGAYVYIVTTAAGSAGKSLYRFDANITAPITLMGNTVTGISAASTAYMTSWNGSVFLAADTLWQLTGSAFVNVNTNFTRVSFPTGDRDALYFAGDAGNNEGIELYQYTADEGVLLAGVVESGPTGSYPSSLVFMNGLLYFSAYSSLYGIELWVHNTSAPLPNAALALDLNPGVSDSLPGNLVTLDNILYFGADDGTHGSEFWKLVNGVFTVYDINPGSESSFPTDLTVIYNLVYFAATNDSVGT